MFKDIGIKIQLLAEILAILGIVLSCVIGVIFFGIGFILETAGVVPGIIGIVILIVGPLVSWLGNFCLYGFGKLIEKSTASEKMLASINDRLNALTKEKIDEENNDGI